MWLWSGVPPGRHFWTVTANYMTYEAFIFESFEYSRGTGELSLRYAFEDGPAFEERIVFPPAAKSLAPEEDAALDASFRLLFLLAGVSYYKAYVPEKLVCRAFSLDEATAGFLEKTYRNGLGEFAYRNGIDLSRRVNFITEKTDPWLPTELDLPQRVLVPVGGGKDSIVTIECLRKAGSNITLFAAGPATGLAEPIRATIETSGLWSLQVRRSLSPMLAELNRSGALNGHVPITAILNSIAVCCAILHSFGAIAFSNERSASEPNIREGTREINHQYSKSLQFEKDFSGFVRGHIVSNLECFSFLRPLSETAIARRFAGLKKYHRIFRSCNSAFRLDEKRRGEGWCCNCPKCRFVFLVLAPFMDKGELVDIFGKNLLDDETQKEGFAELCGLSSHKPFECVGEVGESAVLLRVLSRDSQWKNDIVVKSLAGMMPEIKNLENSFNSLFEFGDDHCLPAKYLEILRACV